MLEKSRKTYLIFLAISISELIKAGIYLLAKIQLILVFF